MKLWQKMVLNSFSINCYNSSLHPIYTEIPIKKKNPIYTEKLKEVNKLTIPINKENPYKSVIADDDLEGYNLQHSSGSCDINQQDCNIDEHKMFGTGNCREDWGRRGELVL